MTKNVTCQPIRTFIGSSLPMLWVAACVWAKMLRKPLQTDMTLVILVYWWLKKILESGYEINSGCDNNKVIRQLMVIVMLRSSQRRESCIKMHVSV